MQTKSANSANLAGTMKNVGGHKNWKVFLTNQKHNSSKIECNLKRARLYTYTEIINCTGTKWEQRMKLINQLLFQTKANSPASGIQGLKSIISCSLSCI